MRKILITLMLSVFSCSLLVGQEGVASSTPTLERAYSLYLQGDLDQSQKELRALLAANPTKQEAYEMQQNLGQQAFMEMLQNRFLQQEMYPLMRFAWQYERNQFKNPRRIEFWVYKYLHDESIRGKALMNLVAAGEYAMPFLIDHLGKKEVGLDKRGLAYQAVLRIGSEGVLALCSASFAKDDTILLVNVVRLLTESRDPRALPYLVRLKEESQDALVLKEVAQGLALPVFTTQLTASRLFVLEAIRYLKEGRDILLESVSTDGIVWDWDFEKQELVSLNILKDRNYEFRPTLPPNLWALFRAEMIGLELFRSNLSEQDNVFARAAIVNAWVAQEHRAAELLDSPKTAKIENIESNVRAFLDRRILEVEVAQWTGTSVMLTALDMANRELSPFYSSRILQLLTEYRPPELLSVTIRSFLTLNNHNPVLEGLAHYSERVRYWSAIAAARSDKDIVHPQLDTIMDLLNQATDEVPIGTVLFVAPVSQATEALRQSIENLGYTVVAATSGFEGLNALREFPSKDIVLVFDKLHKDLSTLEFVDRLRQDYKGRDLPLGIITTDANKDFNKVAFQDHAQELLILEEDINILSERLMNLKRHMHDTVYESEIVPVVSTEAMESLKRLSNQVIRRYPDVIRHLEGVVAFNYHSREQQILATQVLEKFAEMAFNTTPTLLERLFNPTTDDEYKLNILATMRMVSKTHVGVRDALAAMVSDHSIDRRLRIQAASYLGLDQHLLSEDKKRTFQSPFFTRNYPKE